MKGYAGKSVISVCKKAQKEEQMHFMAMKNSRNVLVLWFIHISKTVHFQQGFPGDGKF